MASPEVSVEDADLLAPEIPIAGLGGRAGPLGARARGRGGRGGARARGSHAAATRAAGVGGRTASMVWEEVSRIIYM